MKIPRPKASPQPPMYDLIGDIHGHADALQQLLKKLGYSRQNGIYRHPEHKAIFLGDFIDRGPKIRETLEIVRPMIDSGAALAVMGNHELNALAFHTADPIRPGEHLRPHNEKNSRQHAETLRQVPAGELTSYLAWFRTLPLWLDLDGLRIVHACWDETRMAQISGPVTDEFLQSACLAGGSLLEPVEAILKGKEVALPPGATFRDKDGHERLATRVKWYEPPQGHTYRTYAMASEPIPSDEPLPDEVARAAVPYPPRRQARVRRPLLAERRPARAAPSKHRLPRLERRQGGIPVRLPVGRGAGARFRTLRVVAPRASRSTGSLSG